MRLRRMLACALTFVPLAASASPYAVQAVYSSGDKPEAAVITIRNASVVPSAATLNGVPVRLSRIRLAVDRANLGAVALNAVPDFTVIVRHGMARQIVDVPRFTPAANGDKASFDVIPFDEKVLADAPTATFSVEVHGRYHADLLCAAEMQYRLRRNEARAPAAPVPPLFVGHALPNLAVFAEGKDAAKTKHEVLFSFCDEYRGVNWDAIAGDAKSKARWSFGRPFVTAKDLSDLHKEKLVELLKTSGLLKQFDRPEGEVRVAVDDPRNRDGADHRTAVYSPGEFSFVVARTASSVSVREHQEDGKYRAAEDEAVFSHTSLVSLDARDRNGQCAPVFSAPFAYRLARKEARKDADAKLADAFVAVTLDARENACVADVKVPLKDFLDQTVELTGSVRSDAGEELVVVRKAIKVAQVGFVYSVPVYTEIATAMKAKSSKDFEASSSTPVSWVFPLGGTPSTKSVAVSFAVRLTYAPRSLPALAKIISVYPHASLIFPVDGADTTGKLAVGAGASLVQFLNFAWAVRPRDDDQRAQHYFLVGVSLQDIAKIGR